MGFDKDIDYISHCNALLWVLIRELIILFIVMPCNVFFSRKLIIFLFVMPCAMGFDKGIDYISHCYALIWVLIRELIIFLIVMPCDGF